MQFALTLVVLKALPVLIVGGFTSIGGAIAGGFIIGASESLAEIYLSPLLGGSARPFQPFSLRTASPTGSLTRSRLCFS